MTELEQALAAGGKDVTSDYDAALKAGGKPTGAPSKYPQPASLSKDDQALGVMGGVDLANGGGFDPSPEEMREKPARDAETAKEVLKTLGISAAGGVFGKALGGALAARAAGKAVPALTGTFEEMQAAPVAGKVAQSAWQRIAEASRKAIDHSVIHGTTGAAIGAVTHPGSIAAPIVGAAIGGMAKPVAHAIGRFGGAALSGAASAAPAALPAAGVIGAAALAPTPSSPMTNMLDQLRQSSNPRAAELMSRIEAIKNGGTGQVTQGTLGSGS